MFESLEIIPKDELKLRWQRLKDILQKEQQSSEGIMILSKVGIYWATGHFGSGVFWLPLDGEPHLFIRKGIERAKLESPIENIHKFRSYSDISNILADYNLTLPSTFSVEMGGISWSGGKVFESKFKDRNILPGDIILSKARSVKTQWELHKIKLAGERHYRAICKLLPDKISPGMTELEIGKVLTGIFLDLGHNGIIRMQGQGEELFIGSVSAGDSGNYPTSFNVPVGARGLHPAVPFLGYGGKVWKNKEILIIDSVFSLEGYHTDKTQLFFAGKKDELPKQVKNAQEFCLMIQNECIKKLTPGTTPEEIYLFCIEKAKKYNFEDGFMGIGGNKVRFVGHGVGLYLDEWPPIANRFNEPLEENMVIALEPKVGIPGIGMVGIENTFLVTPSGGVSLTGDEYETIFIE